jgi:hypothetical protein
VKTHEQLRRQKEVPLNPQHQLLRAHVERTVAAPAVIMVTSAETGDGKSLTAHSLALCLARSGRRTALVDLTQPVASAVPRLPGPPGSVRPDFTCVDAAAPGVRNSREAMAAFVEETRAAYEYTILDSPALLSDDVAMGLATVVDGLLLTVRLGRAPSELDQLTMRLIERSNGRVIGLVATLPDAIADFGGRDPVLKLERPRERTRTRISWGGLLRATGLVVFGSVAVTAGATLLIVGSPIRPTYSSPNRSAALTTIEPAKYFSHQLAAHLTHH